MKKCHHNSKCLLELLFWLQSVLNIFLTETNSVQLLKSHAHTVNDNIVSPRPLMMSPEQEYVCICVCVCVCVCACVYVGCCSSSH